MGPLRECLIYWWRLEVRPPRPWKANKHHGYGRG